MSVTALIPVPEIVQQRAWECALVLVQDFPERLGKYAQHYLRDIVFRGPEAVTWQQSQAALQVWRAAVEVRR